MAMAYQHPLGVTNAVSSRDTEDAHMAEKKLTEDDIEDIQALLEGQDVVILIPEE